MTSYVNYFFWFLKFYDFFSFSDFLLFLYFVVFLYLITAVASLFYHSLLLFIFTHRWSTVHHTWVTVLRHVRVPSSSSLLGGKLDGAVADGTVLDMEHLAS